MKIENLNINTTVPFKEINVSDTFIVGNIIYEKIVAVDEKLLGCLNAVDIHDGYLISFDDNAMVLPIDGKFVVERI